MRQALPPVLFSLGLIITNQKQEGNMIFRLFETGEVTAVWLVEVKGEVAIHYC